MSEINLQLVRHDWGSQLELVCTYLCVLGCVSYSHLVSVQVTDDLHVGVHSGIHTIYLYRCNLAVWLSLQKINFAKRLELWRVTVHGVGPIQHVQVSWIRDILVLGYMCWVKYREIEAAFLHNDFQSLFDHNSSIFHIYFWAYIPGCYPSKFRNFGLSLRQIKESACLI